MDFKQSPSKIIDKNFIYNRGVNNFSSTQLSGKWCAFSHFSEIDHLWNNINKMIDEGKLLAGMVSTARGRKGFGDTHVICIFTNDYRDSTEILNVRKMLREAGFCDPMKYKRDIDTFNPPTNPEFEFFYVEFSNESRSTPA